MLSLQHFHKCLDAGFQLADVLFTVIGFDFQEWHLHLLGGLLILNASMVNGVQNCNA